MGMAAMKAARAKYVINPMRPKDDFGTIDLSPSPDRNPWNGCERCGALWDIYESKGTVCWDLFVEGSAMNDLRFHCFFAHDLPVGFTPAPGVTWEMVHHLLHRLKKWGRR